MESKVNCQSCPSLVSSRTRIVLPTWAPSCRLLAIGEAPGENEDAVGEGFVGRAGKTLDDALKAEGFERYMDYGVANIVRCRPEGNRRPTHKEIDACLPHLADFLNAARPRLILAVGEKAARVFFGSGLLWSHVQRVRSEGAFVALMEVHPILSKALKERDEGYWRRGFLVIPMPHTSGLAWNRRCPTGQRWSEIGTEMIRLASETLRYVGKRERLAV